MIGVPRGADQSTAGMHPHIAEDRMAAHAEAGAERAARQRIADQEALRVLALGVEIVDRIVIRVLEAVEPASRCRRTWRCT